MLEWSGRGSKERMAQRWLIWQEQTVEPVQNEPCSHVKDPGSALGLHHRHSEYTVGSHHLPVGRTEEKRELDLWPDMELREQWRM